MNKNRLKTILIVIAAGLAYYGFVQLTGWSIPCPVSTITNGHIHCPGCGVTHMCVELAHFNLSEAFYWNPVILCLLPIWILSLFLWLFGRGKKFTGAVVWFSVTSLFIYCIIRNIPGWPLY